MGSSFFPGRKGWGTKAAWPEVKAGGTRAPIPGGADPGGGLLTSPARPVAKDSISGVPQPERRRQAEAGFPVCVFRYYRG